jgi:ribonucleoside-diphosphate reductase alpha chain
MSLVPEQLAIGLTRHFTSSEVHPYDEIVWERRDARISNWKDGTVAFEQLGVEFPLSWSQNATNIVSQKYFRGTVGTPGRESSLRQVIDRVADTITTWGSEGGYFVDDAEAESFRAELKFILVTQRAAFNSPVWFNIGVPGVPQQASACFILSVDDTMDAILNWYREEGVIFKGGSGSGVNLSKIRSSYEILNGGGTASGPGQLHARRRRLRGTIKSGGKTRRAAKMCILDVDHPTSRSSSGARRRGAQGRVSCVMPASTWTSTGPTRSASSTRTRTTPSRADEFMQRRDRRRGLDADGRARRRTDPDGRLATCARRSRGLWECADPGLQFDTTINRWHTATQAAGSTVEPVQRVHAPRQLSLQPRLDQLAQVPR